MKRQCKALVFSCIDFRIQEAVHQYLENNGYRGDYNLLLLGGEAKNLADGSPEVREFLLSQVAISKELHKIEDIIFITHEDCGAYGGADAYKGRDDELSRHVDNIHKATEMIASEFPSLSFRILYAVIEDDRFVVLERLPSG